MYAFGNLAHYITSDVRLRTPCKLCYLSMSNFGIAEVMESHGFDDGGGPFVVGSSGFRCSVLFFSECLYVCWLAGFWMLVFRSFLKRAIISKTSVVIFGAVLETVIRHA